MGYLLRHSGYRALFGSQALGAFNDNLFKMLVSLYAIDSASAGHSGAYVPLIGIVFVLPYFLFSGYAGYIADIFNKRQVLIFLKATEIAVMIIGSIALASGRLDLLLIVLFLLATQMAFYSPAKYGILPEILPPVALSQAIGLLDMGRYVSVIVGTAFAGFLLKWGGDSPVAIGAFLVAVASIGFIAGQRISPVRDLGVRKKFRANPLGEIGTGLKRFGGDPKLVSIVAGTSFIDFLGAFVMLDMILVGKDAMHASDDKISMLAAFAGLGISLGSVIGGRLSRGRTALGLVPFGMIGAGASIALMALTAASYPAAASLMALMGFCGGSAAVALNASLQRNVGDSERGHLISTNNFLNMAGVLLASCMLWLLHDGLDISPVDILLGLAVGTLLLTFCALKWLPVYASPPLTSIPLLRLLKRSA